MSVSNLFVPNNFDLFCNELTANILNVTDENITNLTVTNLTVTNEESITSSSNQLNLGPANHDVTINANTPANANNILTIPDTGGNDTFAFLAKNQTFTGTDTFSNQVSLTGASNQLRFAPPVLRSITLNNSVSPVNNLVWSFYDTTQSCKLRACIDPFMNISSATVLSPANSGTTIALQDAAAGAYNITMPLTNNGVGWNLRFSVTSLVNGNNINIVSFAGGNDFSGFKFENNTAGQNYGFKQIQIVNAQATIGDCINFWCDGTTWIFQAYSKKAGAFVLS